ncbi:MAG: EF-hand domain-containing protein [Pseudoxanthomonas sp.]
MKNRTPRNAFITLIAMAAAAATPLAFAQDASSMTTQDDMQRAAVQQQSQIEAQSQAADQQRDAATSQQATGAATQAAQQSGASSGQGQQGWADVDTDANGTISKQEATANAGLTQIFDQADADTNGELTPDEYKSFISKNYGGAAGGQPQQAQPQTQN